MKGALLCFSIIIIYLASCSPAKNFRNMNYFADSVSALEKTVQNIPPVTLAPGDRLSIIVSALNPLAAEAFNLNSGTTLDAGNTSRVSSNNGATGYLVNEDGTIPFPQVGKVNVKGKTTQKIADTLQELLTRFLKEPLAQVTLINFKVNVLGEVNRPGTIIVPDGKITILEAISQSGDLTINGLRDNILVVREKEGKREFGRLNVASNQIFNSPYFYLQPGDVVYVDLNKNKLEASDVSQQRNLQRISLIFSSISVLAVILNLIIK